MFIDITKVFILIL